MVLPSLPCVVLVTLHRDAAGVPRVLFVLHTGETDTLAQISVGEPDELLGLGEIGAAKPAVRKGRSKAGAWNLQGGAPQGVPPPQRAA